AGRFTIVVPLDEQTLLAAEGFVGVGNNIYVWRELTTVAPATVETIDVGQFELVPQVITLHGIAQIVEGPPVHNFTVTATVMDDWGRIIQHISTSTLADGRFTLSYVPVGTLLRLEISGFYDGNFYRSEEHTSELQSRENLVCRLL